MNTINTVGIVGAGAMGACLATQFQKATAISTSFIADGQRYTALQRDGLVVNGRSLHLPVVNPGIANEPLDLIVVAVKHHQLQTAIQNLGNLVGHNTVFFSVMNGLESEATIGAVYGMEKVVYAISLGMDALREGNQVSFTKVGMHYFGEAENINISDKVQRIKEAFDKADIHYEIPPDMIRMMWWKFMFNVGINQASAVMRAPFGVFQANPIAQGLMEGLMREVLRVAIEKGVNLTEKDITDWYPVLNRLSPQGKTSMLQDIEAGRKTEVEVFGGHVITLGLQLGIPTPINQTVYEIIRILEQPFINSAT